MQRDASTPPLIAPSDLPTRVAERFVASGASGARDRAREQGRDRRRWWDLLRGPGAGPSVRSRGAAREGRIAFPDGGGSGGGASRSPFLPPYDPALLIGAITPTARLPDQQVQRRRSSPPDRDARVRGAGERAHRRGSRRGTHLPGLDRRARVLQLRGRGGGEPEPQAPPARAVPLGPGGERFPLDRALASAIAAGRDGVRASSGTGTGSRSSARTRRPRGLSRAARRVRSRSRRPRLARPPTTS